MKWVKGNNHRPDGKEKEKLHIKYKGSSDLLIFINGIWYWFEKNIEESRNFPVHESSWAVIEYLDESPSGEGDAVDELEWVRKNYDIVDGDYYHVLDEDGDNPLSGKQVHQFYLQSNKKNNDTRRDSRQNQ